MLQYSQGKIMGSILIKKANFEDIEKEWAFVRDMPEDENGLTNA